jgi:broad specificity phosphatase PhoE
MSKKVYLFRHGETDWNKSKEFKYSEEVRDVCLNELGVEQAKQNAENLKDAKIQHIYTSYMKRANETGKILAEKIGVNYEVIKGLEEFSYYDSTVLGLTKDEIKNKIGMDNYKLSNEDKNALLDWRPLDCETKGEARNRISTTISIILKSTPYEIIGIASHGRILKEWLRYLDYENDTALKNCETIEAEYNDEKFKIIRRFRYAD